jgi:hypothetical protein
MKYLIDTYVVKYLITRKLDIKWDCQHVQEAIEDFMKRHPDVKSQAGMAKTKPLKEGILKQSEPKKRGRAAADN